VRLPTRPGDEPRGTLRCCRGERLAIVEFGSSIEQGIGLLLIYAQICDMVSRRDLGTATDRVHEQVQSTDGRQPA